MHYRPIAVERLPFHEEGCIKVYFRDDSDVENVLERDTNEMSKFTGWMRANEIYSEGRHLLYVEYPTEFTWHARDKEWRPCNSRMKQRVLYDNIMLAIDENNGGLFFVYGSGGTGKTYLWKAIITWIRSMGKIVFYVTSSGIASVLLLDGRTEHLRFRIPLELDSESCCGIDVRPDLACLIQETALIIWDEHDNPNAENQVFGGKVVVLSGDFRRILMVIPNAPRAVVVASAIVIVDMG
ncbi:putative PIF1 DNA helicase/replication protein A1-like protein [Tanacetum coccineum]